LSIDPREITVKLLQQECDPGAYERGKGYFNQGRVNIIEVEVLGRSHIRLLSITRGSRNRIYDQEIDIELRHNKLNINGYCDCPVEFNCKHVVAACLTYQAAQLQPPEQELPDSSSVFTRWLEKTTGNVQDGHGHTEILLYTLDYHPSNGELAIKCRIVKHKRGGGFSKGRAIKTSSLTNYYSNHHTVQHIDEEILALLDASNNYHWDKTLVLGSTGNPALMMMIDTGRAYWGDEREQPLQRGEAKETRLAWQSDKNAYHLRIQVPHGVIVAPVLPPIYIDPIAHVVGELTLPAGIDSQFVSALAEAPAVALKDAQRLSRMLALQYPQIPTPEAVAMRELTGVSPIPQLTLNTAEGDPLDSSLSLDFLYDNNLIDPYNPEAIVTFEQQGELLQIHRDLPAEAIAGERLLTEGLSRSDTLRHSFALPKEEQRQRQLARWFRFNEETLPQLEKEGWQIKNPQSAPLLLSRADSIQAEVESTDNDWFALRFDIEINGKKVPLLPLVSELIGDYRPGTLPPTLYLPYEKGHYIEVESAQIEPILQNIIEIFDSLGAGSELKLSRLDAPRLLELGETQVNGGAELKRLAKKLANFSGIKPIKVPTTFKGELRDYQQQGVNWLQFLREYELAGLLADDMGLGKTVQALAHLAVEKRAGRMKLPSLIVAPTSLMGNWRREAAQFTPGLKVVVLHGPNRHEHFDSLQQYDLILTTYPLLARDSEILQSLNYHYLILDEAQVIKNHRSQAAQLVRSMKTNHRLSLTGTPMENHLGELWSQFDFLLPGFLGAQQQFVRNYRTPIEKHGDTDKLKRLTRRIAPFMLRRTKEMVATELPAKSELIRSIPIEGKQAVLYESIRLTMEKKIRDAITKQGLARSHITILDALLKLRQVCCDPRLLPSQKGDKITPSAKFDMLMEMIPELLDEGRRILLFSQFTKMLGLIETGLNDAGIPYTKLTGQTRKRDEAIETFRSGEVNLFLISLKAGGVGLNLTEADTVIHYDPWWNPAVESQATDRAHRIGQDKPVFVYKLITEGTVEEKIIALQDKKRKLANSVYGKGKKEDNVIIDEETIRTLLSPD
jgi:SNF2 family DNA or RNA helicase